ncbi:hypothetical protein A9Q89_00335 [Gammaproteobacteria bacterium 53_120_T64]|nr:hypothetical protein A9Q89_00335 [Gammaproteobacteria bacterium 53_120_T64]
MPLIIILIRIVLIFFILAMASILIIKPFVFEFVTMSVLCLGLITPIWWTTSHLKRRTPPALYMPRIGMLFGSTLLITGLLGLIGFYFDSGNPTSSPAAFGIDDSVIAVIGGLLIFRAAKSYT